MIKRPEKPLINESEERVYILVRTQYGNRFACADGEWRPDFLSALAVPIADARRWISKIAPETRKFIDLYKCGSHAIFMEFLAKR